MMDFMTLAFNPLGRSNEIVRYSSVHQETNETLAEHVTDVSLMSYIIAKQLEQLSKGEEKIDLGVLLEKALLHDADEVLTGDVPRNTKYATSQVHEELNKVADEAMDLINEITGFDFKSIWTAAKEGKEGYIVKVVDMLVVVKKAITEVELRGNMTFLKVVDELEAHTEKLISKLESSETTIFSCDCSYNYLVDLLKQAHDEVVAIRIKYAYVTQKYLIYENVIRGE